MEKLDKVARYGVDGYGRQDIYRDDEGGEFVYHDDFKAMQQRAEAAEAKLAELEKQEPVAWRHDNGPFGKVATCSIKAADSWKDIGFEVTPLFARPAPAVSLAELVSDDEFRVSFERWMIDDMKCIIGSSDPYPAGIEARNWNAWKACLAAILRNIEEAK